MKKDEILNYIINNLNNGEDEYEIERYLKIKDIDPAEFPSLFEIAKQRITAENLKTFPKKNKTLFAVWVSLTITFFVVFVFILPSLNIISSVILSTIGALCISFFLFNSITYYKSWEKDFIIKVGKPKMNVSAFLALAFIPTIILYFIIDWRFSSMADSILKDTQEDAIATVIDGKSIKGKRFSFAEIRVKFTTKEGKEIEAVEDVTTYRFKEFYKGQVMNIVYSKDNPLNIDLLIDKENIQQLKNTQERGIEADDLINLITTNHDDVGSTLNKISIGWVYDEQQSSWLNEKRQCIIMKTSNGITFLSTKMEYNYTFPRELIRMGFKKTSTDDPEDLLNTGNKTFENDKYIINVKSVVLNNTQNSVISIQEK